MAMACQVRCRDSVLPCNVSSSGNIISDLCWDNFDLTEETPSGSGTTHSTHGILIQEVSSSCVAVPLESHLPRKPVKTKFVLKPLPACYSKKRIEPLVTATAADVNIQTQPGSSEDSSHVVHLSDTELMWLICRIMYNSGYSIPNWNGWVSVTAEPCEVSQKSVIGSNSTSDYGIRNCTAMHYDIDGGLQKVEPAVHFHNHGSSSS